MMPSSMQSSASPSLSPPGRVDATRWFAVAFLLALIVLSVLWEMWLAPIRPGGSPVIAGIKALPLCIPLAGLLRMRMYTYRWLSLLVWLYFIDGVVRAYGATGTLLVLALLEILLCLLLFAACIAHVRLRLGPRRPKP
jgi:uncharacterized membrane protein